MGQSEEKLIDLTKLSQRELLIVLANDVRELKDELKEVKQEQHKMALQVNTLKTQSKMAGGIVGFISGLVSGIIGSMFSTR